MLCVLHLRSRGLPLSWGNVCCSICLTKWVTHDPSTAVRATTSLRGERAHQRCLFSPLPTVFSRALFSTTLPSLGKNGHAEPFPRFHEINFIPLRFVQHPGNVQPTGVCHRGMGREESGGLGEKTRKGKGDCSRAAPLPLGCLPKITVNPYCVSAARRLSENAHKQMVTKSRTAECAPHAEHKRQDRKRWSPEKAHKKAPPPSRRRRLHYFASNKPFSFSKKDCRLA